MVGADDLTLVLRHEPVRKTSQIQDLLADELTGDLDVTLANTGTKKVKPAFSLVATGADADCAEEKAAFVVAPADGRASVVPVGGHETYVLDVTADSRCLGVPTALIVTGTGLKPATAAVEIQRHIGWYQVLPPLIAAVLAGVTFAGVALLKFRRKLDWRTPGGKAWGFSDSWLTSITAITGGLTVVLTVTGLVNELLPGIPLGNFLGLSLTFSAVLLAAPLVFSIHTKVDEVPQEATATDREGNAQEVTVKQKVVNGTVRGLCWAGAMTCAGAAGVITMLAVLTLLSGAPNLAKGLVIFLLVVLAIAIGWYAKAATQSAIRMSTEKAALDTGTSTATLELHAGSPGFTGTL